MKSLFNFVLSLLISFNLIFAGVMPAFARSRGKYFGSKTNRKFARRSGNLGARISKATGGQKISQDIHGKTPPPPKEEKKEEEKKPMSCLDPEQNPFLDSTTRFSNSGGMNADKIIYGQSFHLKKLLTSDVYDFYFKKGSYTTCLKEQVCFGPYMSVMGRNSKSTFYKNIGRGIACFIVKPETDYTFGIIGAPQTKIDSAIAELEGDAPAKFQGRRIVAVNIVDTLSNTSSAGEVTLSHNTQYQDFMRINAQEYIDYDTEYNNIQKALEHANTTCKAFRDGDNKNGLSWLYTLMASSAGITAGTTALSGTAMITSAISSAKTTEIIKKKKWIQLNGEYENYYGIKDKLAYYYFIKFNGIVYNYYKDILEEETLKKFVNDVKYSSGSLSSFINIFKIALAEAAKAAKAAKAAAAAAAAEAAAAAAAAAEAAKAAAAAAAAEAAKAAAAAAAEAEAAAANKHYEKVIDIFKTAIPQFQNIMKDVVCDNCNYIDIEKEITKEEARLKNIKDMKQKFKINISADQSLENSTKALDNASGALSVISAVGSGVGTGLIAYVAVQIKKTKENRQECGKAIKKLDEAIKKYKSLDSDIPEENKKAFNDKIRKSKIDKVAPYISRLDEVLSNCAGGIDKDDKVLNKIYAEAIGGSVTSGVGTATSIVSAGLSFGAAAKKIDKNSSGGIGAIAETEKTKSLRTGAAVTAGVSTALNGVSMGLSSVVAVQLEKLMEKTRNCINSIEETSMNPITLKEEEKQELWYEGGEPVDYKPGGKNKEPDKKGDSTPVSESGQPISNDIHNATSGREEKDKQEGEKDGKPEDSQGKDEGDKQDGKDQPESETGNKTDKDGNPVGKTEKDGSKKDGNSSGKNNPNDSNNSTTTPAISPSGISLNDKMKDLNVTLHKSFLQNKK